MAVWWKTWRNWRGFFLTTRKTVSKSSQSARGGSRGSVRLWRARQMGAKRRGSHLNCSVQGKGGSVSDDSREAHERRGTDEVVEDVVSLHARGPGVVVADGVEEAVLPDDGDDLSSVKGSGRPSRQAGGTSRGGRVRRTSSSMRASRRAEPLERRKLCSMNNGLKPA